MVTGSPAIHGLVLLGTDRIYAVHMATFAAPYDYQAVMRVTGKAEQYHAARQRFGTSAALTVLPNPGLSFEDATRKEGFAAELFLGHFAKGGEPLGRMTVRIGKVLQHRALTPPGPSEAAALSYDHFGGVDIFMSHRLTARPDFDQVLTAQLVSDDFFPVLPALQEPEQVATVTLPERPNDLTGRLRPGDRVKAADRELRILAEVYLEADDLA
ncbi:hypothetical protein ACFZBU_40985 [Embleya sp. NPDC008237]|uniref:hypothetical protein n=1 Tax=Embleya sp. NPDC008237 TaxID=3363978 RepID=UPI0036E8FB2D